MPFKKIIFRKKFLSLLSCFLYCTPHFAAAEPIPAKSWDILGQFTSTYQYHPAFTSPYQGENSMNSSAENATTADLTLYAGIRLWNGELWINPEIDQGFGLSNTVGMAGYSSGEAYKVGSNDPYYRLSRFFYRYVANLGGEEQAVAASANELGRVQTSDNLIFTAGKFSVTDVFDTNIYAHDPRADFFNWSIVESGAVDYAADAWGYTQGAAVEWTQSKWTLRGGFFALSTIPNTTTIDTTFNQHEWIIELEERHQLWGHPGKLKLLGFINQGNMGSYADAIKLAQQSNTVPNTELVRRPASNTGFAINFEQEISSTLGGFTRASMNEGNNEAFDFTEINQSIAAGLSLHGDHWGRHNDTLGFAAVVNGLSKNAKAYFSGGGMGILIGDGNLNYDSEKIMEIYYAYSLPGFEHLMLSANYQRVINPAYNQDRGPINIFGTRIHAEF